MVCRVDFKCSHFKQYSISECRTGDGSSLGKSSPVGPASGSDGSSLGKSTPVGPASGVLEDGSTAMESDEWGDFSHNTVQSVGSDGLGDDHDEEEVWGDSGEASPQNISSIVASGHDARDRGGPTDVDETSAKHISGDEWGSFSTPPPAPVNSADSRDKWSDCY